MIQSFLQIVRWPNLLMVGLIQWLVYLKLLQPDFSVMIFTDMSILVWITILLTASGFLINDYYDTETDSINRPHRRIAGEKWSLSIVRRWYFILVGFGGILAFWLAWRLGLARFIWMYPMAAASLWYYSYALKCTPVIGNLWVSLFGAGMVIIVGLPDIIEYSTKHLRPEFWWYVVFAFLSTWYREIVKDLEDQEGDAMAGCKTFVVRYGVMSGKRIAMAVGLLLVCALTTWFFLQPHTAVRILLVTLLLMVLGTLLLLRTAVHSQSFHRVSTLIKGLMVGGILIVLCL